MGQVRTDPMTRAAYVSDASIYRRVPHAVALPGSVEELREVISEARLAGLPVIARGGGTSVAGNAIGEGVLVDTSKHLNRILSIDSERRRAVVQPGVVCDALRAESRRYGLTYGPDPSTHSRCTIGGMVANNACGSHSVAWGTSATNLVAAQVMLADGRVVRLFKGGTSDPEITRRLVALRDRYRSLLRTELGRFPRQVSGYGLHFLLEENGFDVAKAFAGTEGTCGVATELTVDLVEPPAVKRLAVLTFDDVFSAAALAHRLRLPGVFTVEGLGGDLLREVGDHPGIGESVRLLPKGGGWLFCEAGGADEDELAEVVARMRGVAADAVRDFQIFGGAEARALWKLRDLGAGLASRPAGGTSPWPGWEDSAVPPSELAGYLAGLYELLDRHNLSGVPFGHFGEGCVHVRITFDFDSPEGLACFEEFMRDAAALVSRHGGSLSGEHGDGRARSELLGTMYSPEMLDAFAEFKQIFDPDGAFNPGVLVQPDGIGRGIRPAPGARTMEIVPRHQFAADGGSIVNAVNRCVGVGACRSDDGGMCPSFQVTRDEVHSTRGRARVLSEMLRGEFLTDGWRSKETRDALDLCLSCHACSSECPVGVDMSRYKAEFLHQHHGRGLGGWFGQRRRPLAHLTLGWLPTFLRIAGHLPGAAVMSRLVARTVWLRRIVMRAAGLDSSRSLITMSATTLMRWHRLRERNSPTEAGSGPRIVLWPDTFTNSLAVPRGTAAVRVLEALGYHVEMPAKPVCCGLTFHSTGQLDRAAAMHRSLMDTLDADLAADTPIVVLEPSCEVMLRTELPELNGYDPRARALSEAVVGFGAFVAAHRRKGGVWPFVEPSAAGSHAVAAQVHCHQQASRKFADESEVLAALGFDEPSLATGCCGLAGNWGFEPGHGDMSRDIAARNTVPVVEGRPDGAPMLADGFSCRTQISEICGETPQHLAELMASLLAAPKTEDR